MFREKIGPVIWLLMAALIVGASIGFSFRANATEDDVAYAVYMDGQNVCDTYTTHGITEEVTLRMVLELMETYDLTKTEAGMVLVHSVSIYCEENHQEFITMLEGAGS